MFIDLWEGESKPDVQDFQKEIVNVLKRVAAQLWFQWSALNNLEQ